MPLTPSNARSARPVINAEFDPIGVAEIELGKIAVKVFLAAMLVDAHHAAFEYAVIALDGVSMHFGSGLAVGVALFLAPMVNRVVPRKFIAELSIATGLIGHNVSFAVQICANDWHNVVFLDALDMEGTGRAATLHKGKDRVLVASAALDLKALFPSDIGFVDLDNSARSAHGRKLAGSHSLADAMAEEPSGFQATAESALKLASADALLARAEQIDCLKPDIQLHMAGLENGSHADGEWLAARIALVEADAGGFALSAPLLSTTPQCGQTRPKAQSRASTYSKAASSLWKWSAERADFMAIYSLIPTLYHGGGNVKCNIAQKCRKLAPLPSPG